MPTIKDVSTGLKLALELIRKFLPDGTFSRIYVDEQPTESGSYVAGAVALESGDINSAGVAMFKIKPQTSNVRLYWAGNLPGSLTAEELRNANRNAVLEADGQARSGEGVNISYNDADGMLSGNMNLNTYYLMGTDKTYSEPYIPGMPMGVETIFGNVE